MANYYGNFNNWEDVQTEFDMKEPEPEDVIYANYETGNYEGDAIVVYRNGNQYFVNEAGHCSCYGLEGKWSPEPYDKDTLIAAWEKSDPYGVGKEAKPVILALK